MAQPLPGPSAPYPTREMQHVAIVDVAGDLVTEQDFAPLFAYLHDLVRRRKRRIILNLDPDTQIGDQTIAELRKLRNFGTSHVCFVGLSKLARLRVETSRVGAEWEIAESIPEALAGLQRYFEAEVTTCQVQGVTIVGITGRQFSSDDGDLLQERIAALTAGSLKKVVFVFGPKTMHEVILHDLVEAAKVIAGHGAAVRFVLPDQKHRDVWAVTKVQTFFPAFATEEEAIASFQS